MSLPASPVLSMDNVVRKPGPRRTRTFTPEGEKDATYWQRRLKNNESAKRSRDKRRLHDFMLERHVAALREENIRLRAQLLALQDHYALLYTSERHGYLSHPGLVIPMHGFNSVTGFSYTPIGIYSTPVCTYSTQLLATPVGSLITSPPTNEPKTATCTGFPPDSPQVETRQSPHGDDSSN
ncbi:nuclear factor interleukin-3-regulated protein-like [Hippocampus comes]|uniref:nuclear factor interleukin-3-regulated protein-like n=1 Tax=Hippocampus comes TaxID=109280 RepID=UPI00094E68DF|nr:PREDICTED: nuclear factor interleukin-3-regulated protein-like [Hippocampus comes]